MPRRMQNIKNKIRAEEELVDIDLKAAGLWEEGLSYNDKRQLLKLIADSKTTAEEEETRRQVIYSGTISKPKLRNVEIKEGRVGDDSDPEITYESPFSKNQRNSAITTSKSIETPKVIGQNDLSCQKREESTPQRLQNKDSLKSNKHIQSLLSNSSITIRYAPNVSQNASTSRENIVSETDEESDGDNCDPLIISEKGRGSQENNVKKLSKEDEEQCDVVPVDNVKVSSEDKICNLSNVDSSMSKLKLTQENEKKALSACNETSKLESMIIEQELKSVSIGAIEKNDQISITKKTDSNRPTSSLLSMKKNVIKKPGSFVFVPGSISSPDSKPLRTKRKILNEKPNRAFLKASFETETNCVKRIYSLIADWQSALSEYQRSRLGSCKWGPPICVDRQLTDSLLRKRSNKTASRRINTVSESGESSASDTRISDRSSDDDWNIFTHKRKTNSYRTHYTRRSNPLMEVKSNEMDYFEPSFDDENVLPDLDAKDLHHGTFRELSPPIASTSNAGESEASVNNSHQEEASEIQGKSSDKHYVKSVKNNGRKTFHISPDEKYKSVPVEKSSSKLFDTPPPVSKETNVDEQDIASINETKKSPDVEECSAVTNVSSVANQLGTKRGGIKRRRISSASNMPPLKKPTSEKQNDLLNTSSIIPLETSKRSKEIENNVLEDPAELQESVVPSSPPTIKCTIPKESETGTQKHCERLEEVGSEGTEPIEVEEIQDKEAAISEDDFMECPLCQISFSNQEIEAHASECNGPVEEVQQEQPQPSTSTRLAATERARSRLKISNNLPMDVMYLETRSQASHSKN